MTLSAAGSAVRVITYADGSDVWVTARESDALLLFPRPRCKAIRSTR
jgi:hypothetical protein